jgi:hypothetical protein
MISILSLPLTDARDRNILKSGDDHSWFGHVSGDDNGNFANAVVNPWFSLFVTVEEGGVSKKRLLLKGASSVTFIRQGGNDRTSDFTFSGIVGTTLIFITGPKIIDKIDAVWNNLSRDGSKPIYTSRVKIDGSSDRYEGILHVDFGLDDITYRMLCIALLKAPGGLIKELQPDTKVLLSVKTVAPLAGIGQNPIKIETIEENINLRLDDSVRCIVRCVSEGSSAASGNSEPCVKLVGYWENINDVWTFVVTTITYTPYKETGP